jgi:outer membrane protein TolC
VTEQSVAQSKRHLEFARAARETGRLPQADVLRAESLLASAELLDERTKNAERNAQERLRTLIHDEQRAPYEIGEDLLSTPEAPAVEDKAELFRQALELRPELKAFAENRKAISIQRSSAKTGALPHVDGFGNAYLGNPNPRYLPPQQRWDATWDVGVQLSFSPNDFGSADATIRAADAKAKKLDAERAALVDALRDEIAEALVAAEEARFALDTAEHGLTSAEEAYRVRRELFELGRATNVELIDAESDVLRARLEMIQAKVDARIARVRLDHAVGRDALPGSSRK